MSLVRQRIVSFVVENRNCRCQTAQLTYFRATSRVSACEDAIRSFTDIRVLQQHLLVVIFSGLVLLDGLLRIDRHCLIDFCVRCRGASLAFAVRVASADGSGRVLCLALLDVLIYALLLG